MKNVIRERPILFSGEMVRAILEGRKTQTRRVVKPQPVFTAASHDSWEWGIHHTNEQGMRNVLPQYARYSAGSLAWVRETWAAPFGKDGVVFHRADGPDRPDDGTWRPSIFMPRWASRITLEITQVRVERLQDITEDDAKAEGVTVGGTKWDQPNIKTECGYQRALRGAFCDLWDSLNAKRGFGWEKNPWVFVLDFKRVIG
jgi:hypothetical protein